MWYRQRTDNPGGAGYLPCRNDRTAGLPTGSGTLGSVRCVFIFALQLPVGVAALEICKISITGQSEQFSTEINITADLSRYGREKDVNC